MEILLSDTVHLHKKNFTSLFDFFSGNKDIKVKSLQAGKNLWNRYGDYAGISLVENRALTLESLSADQIRSLCGRINGASVNAFSIARSEILSYALAKCPNWFGQQIPNDDEFICSKLFNENPHLLRLNIAATLVWCDIYTQELNNLHVIKAAIVFSGSQIYQRLLLAACQTTRARAFVTESFQTGTEYYFEERYSPITTGSDIRFDTVYHSLLLNTDYLARRNEENKAINKLLNAKNKNVTQPDTADIPDFPYPSSTILLAAQVQNDFSLIESELSDLNPITNYKTLIDEILSQTDFNIIVKTHPWERKKNNLQTPFTFDHLTAFVNEKDEKYRARIHICEDANIKKLMAASDAFVTLNSQAAFEACIYGGLRPYVLGSPFYGRKGFTNDFNSAEELVRALVRGPADWSLSLEDYDKFLEFLTKLLQLHLPSVYKSGLPIIRSRLLGPQFVEVGVTPPPPAKAAVAPAQTTSTAAPKPAAKPAPAVNPAPAAKPKLAVTKVPASLPNNLLDKLHLAKWTTRRRDGTIEIGRGDSGHGVFGPYLPVKPGRYALKLALDLEEPLMSRFWSRDGSLVIDVAINGGKSVVTERRIALSEIKGNGARQELQFVVPGTGDSVPIEMRIWTDGKSKILIREASLHQTG